MNIYTPNAEWNPDYPVPNGYGFEQYCYQQAAPSMEYYYTGQSIYPVNNDPYSRSVRKHANTRSCTIHAVNSIRFHKSVS